MHRPSPDSTTHRLDLSVSPDKPLAPPFAVLSDVLFVQRVRQGTGQRHGREDRLRRRLLLSDWRPR